MEKSLGEGSFVLVINSGKPLVVLNLNQSSSYCGSSLSCVAYCIVSMWLVWRTTITMQRGVDKFETCTLESFASISNAVGIIKEERTNVHSALAGQGLH